MRLSQAADFRALGGQTILELTIEEYYNAHLANKRVHELNQPDKGKIKKRIR